MRKKKLTPKKLNSTGLALKRSFAVAVLRAMMDQGVTTAVLARNSKVKRSVIDDFLFSSTTDIDVDTIGRLAHALKTRIQFGLSEGDSLKANYEYNLNNFVYVRLTDYGRSIAREKVKAGELVMPEEDKNGVSKWILWELMATFGVILYNGNPNIPFEKNEILVTIRIKE